MLTATVVLLFAGFCAVVWQLAAGAFILPTLKGPQRALMGGGPDAGIIERAVQPALQTIITCWFYNKKPKERMCSVCEPRNVMYTLTDAQGCGG